MAIQTGEDIVASDFVSTSSGAPDSGKVAKLNASGQIPQGFLEPKVDTQLFSGNGTWTKPSYGTIAFIEAWGAGGSGAAANFSTDTIVSGGAGGEYRAILVPLFFLGATETVTLGVGGTAVTPVNNAEGVNGNAGGDTTFGSHLTAKGGAGGSTAGTASTGGTGGTSTFVSCANYNGGAGGGASNAGNGTANAGASTTYSGAGGGGVVSDTNDIAAAGGTSTYGGNGGAGAVSATAIAATAGSAKGGGGGGAIVINNLVAQATSGAGGAGYVRVTVF